MPSGLRDQEIVPDNCHMRGQVVLFSQLDPEGRPSKHQRTRRSPAKNSDGYSFVTADGWGDSVPSVRPHAATVAPVPDALKSNASAAPVCRSTLAEGGCGAPTAPSHDGVDCGASGRAGGEPGELGLLQLFDLFGVSDASGDAGVHACSGSGDAGGTGVDVAGAGAGGWFGDWFGGGDGGGDFGGFGGGDFGGGGGVDGGG